MENQEDLFSLEAEENTKEINEKFLKDTYDYDIRFFIHEKSLVIQAPTWRMRDSQSIDTYFDEFRRNSGNCDNFHDRHSDREFLLV